MSNEWKKLDPLSRACILLVSEGVKPGSTFSSKYRANVEGVLEKLELPYLHPEWNGYDYVYTIARDGKELSDYVLKLEKSPSERQAHRTNGVFYGFPECCIDKYVGTILERGKDYQRRNNMPFDNLLKEYERLKSSHPDEFDYKIPGMTPCKLDCSNALKVLRKYGNVLMEYDVEAAEELRAFNRKEYRIRLSLWWQQNTGQVMPGLGR